MRITSVISLLILGLSESALSSPETAPNYPRQVPVTQPNEWVPWERINRNDSALLIVDHQIGLFQLTRDWDSTMFMQNMLAHAELGKLFELPVIMTTSTETGPNGPLPKEIVDMFPDAPIISRKGEVNAWDDPAFREAVRKTGKKQFIIGGIVTDVCTSFLALSLRSEGYSVFANVEASGTVTTLLRDTANMRMQAAGVHLVSSFAILGDLMRDWRTPTPGIQNVVPWISKYMPGYGMLAKTQASAILRNGTVLPGSELLI